MPVGDAIEVDNGVVRVAIGVETTGDEDCVTGGSSVCGGTCVGGSTTGGGETMEDRVGITPLSVIDPEQAATITAARKPRDNLAPILGGLSSLSADNVVPITTTRHSRVPVAQAISYPPSADQRVAP